MNKLFGLVGGAMLGAVAMYLLDPEKGSDRRAMVKEKANDYAKTGGKAISTAAQAVKEKATSITKHSSMPVNPNISLADSRIIEAVEAVLSKGLRFPKAVNVMSVDGMVTLMGPILTKEVEALLKKVRGIKGVTGVDNQMQAHESADGIDAFHATHGSNGSNGGSLLSHVNPRQLAMGIVGLGLTAYAIKKRGAIGVAAGTVGKTIMEKAFHRGSSNGSEMDMRGSLAEDITRTTSSSMIDSASTQVPASAM